LRLDGRLSSCCGGTAWTVGTTREREPKATLSWLRPVLPLVGITRVANVTWLDHVGVPTWMVVRPLAKSLSVSQGKGLTNELAICSGLMESIELHHAETFQPSICWRSLDDSVDDPVFVPIAQLPVLPSASLRGDMMLDWTLSTDLMMGDSVFLPWELFDLDFTKNPRPASLFISSSSGLASGNSRDEAILHALCEVIERDQIAFWMLRRHYAKKSRPTMIRLESIDDPWATNILANCAEAGISVYLWYCAEDLEIPTFKCAVVDRFGRTLFAQQAGGSGAHPRKEIALARALTEALQSRLTHIAGSRDDLYWSRYRDSIPSTSVRAVKSYERYDAEGSIEYGDIQSIDGDVSISSLNQGILRELELCGLARALFVNLTDEALGIPVVFVSVPGLESNIAHSHYVPNARAMDFLVALE
jgi:YcaO-like protein with predicted kinase domain